MKNTKYVSVYLWATCGFCYHLLFVATAQTIGLFNLDMRQKLLSIRCDSLLTDTNLPTFWFNLLLYLSRL
jgi:hypothetical protein